jgi:hypothetical protein
MSKTFSQHAVDKIDAIMKEHSTHVGSQLKKNNPNKYKNFVSSDCITMAIWALKYAFEKSGNPEASQRVGGLGEKGTELAKYLINTHRWKAVYYNPDVNHPRDRHGEHIVSYYNQVKKNCTYSVGRVPVSNTVVNYKPSKNIVTTYLGPTKKKVTDYNTFSRIPFGLGMSRGGMHVWLYSKEFVYESHWEKEATNGLYTKTQLKMFPWLSGVIVVPPDYHHLLTVTTTNCE